MDNLSLLYSEILRAFRLNSALRAVFLDIRSAYDNVLAHILIEKLKVLGFSSNLLAFIFNLVSARSLSFNFGDIDSVRWVHRGLPQGSVLSPLLYAIYVKDLESVVDPRCLIFQYADDVAIAVPNIPLSDALICIKSTMYNVDEYLSRIGLSLAPTKTSLVVFEKGKRHTNDNVPVRRLRQISFKGTRITESGGLRFLGLQLQSNLNWSLQINNVIAKCQNPLKILGCLRHTWWGADPTLLMRLYIALIRSRIEYGGFLLHGLTKEQSLKLERIQLKALRLALGYRTSTPTNVILAEAKLPPLSLRFKYLGRNYITRALSNSDHQVLPILQDLIDLIDNPTVVNRDGNIPLVEAYREHLDKSHLLASSNKPLCFSFDYESILFRPRVSFKEGILLQESPDCNRCFNDTFEDTLSKTVCFYTDGSKLSECPFVGFSVVRANCPDSFMFRSAGFSSIFTAEALAIAEALKIISEVNDKNFTIFSDSKSVLMALMSLSNTLNKSYLIGYIKDKLRILSESGKVVSFFWIPAHKGIVGNERADQMAKAAARSGRDTQLCIPASDFKSLWKSLLKEEFHEWCLSSGQEKGTFYFRNYYQRRSHPWFHKMNLNRRSIVSLNRLRSGHTSLGSSLNRFNIVPSATCSCKLGDETANHIFWLCPRFDQQRFNLISQLKNRYGIPPYSVESFLCDMDYPAISAFSNFINKINIFM